MFTDFKKKFTPIKSIATFFLLCVFGVVLFVNMLSEAAPPSPQKASVNYKIVKKEKIYPWSHFSGKCRAIDYVEIRPRVTGVMQEVLFKEGSLVKKDTPLFTIDPRPFEAALERAKANLEAAYSKEKLASRELRRTTELVKTNAAAKKEFDERTSTEEVSKAGVEAAKSALRTAQLDLEYAHIKAPIEGKISRAEVTPGNLVETGANAPMLTTIVSTASFYVDFDMDEKSYIDAARSFATTTSNAETLPIKTTLNSGGDRTYTGYIKYFDNKINPSTGTIKVRGLVENTDGVLVSGMFVRVSVGTREGQEAIFVSDEAVGTDQNKKFVYILDAENKVTYREVKLGRSIAEGYVIESGLQEGDKVIVKGVQRIRPGMVVDASEAKEEKPDSKNPSTPPIQSAKSDEKEKNPEAKTTVTENSSNRLDTPHSHTHDASSSKEGR